jgi:hypothetical protein
MTPKNGRSHDLTRRLAHPIVLTGGPRSRLETLQDVAMLIRDLRAVPAGAPGLGPRGRGDPARRPRWDRPDPLEFAGSAD